MTTYDPGMSDNQKKDFFRDARREFGGQKGVAMVMLAIGSLSGHRLEILCNGKETPKLPRQWNGIRVERVHRLGGFPCQ